MVRSRLFPSYPISSTIALRYTLLPRVNLLDDLFDTDNETLLRACGRPRCVQSRGRTADDPLV